MEVAKFNPDEGRQQIVCHKVKNPIPEDQALVVPRGDLLY